MDRITEALERAQAQDVWPGEASPHDTLRAHVAPFAPAVHKGEFLGEFLRSTPGRPPIVYTTTRIVNVPPEELVRCRVSMVGAEAEFIDSVKLVRTQIVQRMGEGGWRSLAVVSPDHGEGKTFMAVNFAVSVAAEGDNTVLLVDANLQRPAVHQFFGISRAPGLANLLVDHAPLHSMLINPGIERLVLLPAGTPQTNSAELLGSSQMAALVADIKSRYNDRIVVIDLPPLLRSADALTFAPLADAIVMVVEDNHSNREDITRSQQLLKATNLIGVILNKARDKRTDPLERIPGFLKRLLNRG